MTNGAAEGMYVESNTLHAVLVPGESLTAARAAFECFGEVLSLDPLSDDTPNEVVVVYYDVRASARAFESIGANFCQFGPQHGSRTVLMPGDAQFDSENFARISGVHCDPDGDGSYTVELYDIRDATQCRAEYSVETEAETALPSDLLGAPPGLEGIEPAPGLPPPPGLEDMAAVQKAPAQPVCQVTVSGVPNKLLSNPMMEAILQQAGFEGAFVSFSTHSGKPCGSVNILFSDSRAAAFCARHFEGCLWDGSGTAINAKVTPVNDCSVEPKAMKEPPPAKLSAEAPVFEPFHMLPRKVVVHSSPVVEEVEWPAPSSRKLSADAPEFQSRLSTGSTTSSLSSDAPVFTPAAATAAPALSAKAPVFVPGSAAAQEKAVSMAAAPEARTAVREKLGVSSDTSTEVGESEAEDDRGSPRAPLST